MSRIGTLLWEISCRVTGLMAKANGLPPTKVFKGETFRIYPRIYPQRDIAREKADFLHEKGFGVILHSYINNYALVEVVAGYNQTLLSGCDAI